MVKTSLKPRLYSLAIKGTSIIHALGLFVVVVFVAAAAKWPGSFPSYVLLSLAFNWLLIDALIKQYSVGYLFLAVVTWIGYWLKFSLNTIFSAVWMEPIGNFNFSVEQVDTVATVASIGALGILLAGKLFGSIVGKPHVQPPVFSIIDNRYYWWAGLSAVVTLSVLNEVFHFVQAFRPPPVLDLPFRLQGLITWYFGGGWSLLLMIPFYRSFSTRSDVSAVVMLVLAGVVVSTTVFSRGVLVFQALVILLPMLVYRDLLPKITFRKMALYGFIIFLGICLSVMAAMERRSNFFEGVAPERATSWTSNTWFYIAKLPIDRWIGLEGLMAATSFEGKSPLFFVERLMEERVPGKVDFYTRHIALNPASDTNTVVYSSPPGFMAFAYFSDNQWFVGWFSLFLTLLLLASERVVISISGNPFLASAIGVGLTVQIIHIGTGGIANPLKIFATSLAVAVCMGWWCARSTRRQAGVSG